MLVLMVGEGSTLTSADAAVQASVLGSDQCPGTGSGPPVDVDGCWETEVDSDADGVCDPGKGSPLWCTGSDQCPGTGSGPPVDVNGCPLPCSGADSDCDGVPDNQDQCSGTAGGLFPDANGCSQTPGDSETDSLCDPAKASPLWCTGSDQ